MWLRWLPWKSIVRRAAKAHGFIDPISIFVRLQQFAQPSEVAEPIELLRAGAVFHARGLINTRAIQHNLDWVWPYWVNRQFDPLDSSFLPRAYSLTHINLTHRNWTAVGVPNCQALPIVDPRGLVTPFFDGWSIDASILCEDGTSLQPSRLRDVPQRLNLGHDHLSILTESKENGLAIQCDASVEMVQDHPVCRIRYQAQADRPAFMVIALRPYNPEGISFIHDIILRKDSRGCAINKRNCLSFNQSIEQFKGSAYRNGDVFHRLLERPEVRSVECDLGLATASALFRIPAGEDRAIRVDISLSEDKESLPLFASGTSPESWSETMQSGCRLRIPDKHLQFLYDAAIRTLILHSPFEVFPGPYTYKRFWFRDAAFILHALLCSGFIERVERALDFFPTKQTILGFFSFAGW